ncbi:hypothetical protein [Flagellimonas sp. CMM7]|uniref:DUF7009 family protein n=1 Tax=Flagellimonas sp. CMM7 TaxID=2654676 RepID=UPI0013D4FF9A|nr:hypothetical protein [Flagellimonas sp. CMM7]UII81266.1 hypothetical protein LV704_07045 [Flagellimonas sp. CMM7]
MKIRIKGNSVRFRLTKTEVETFGKTGNFTEITHFRSKVFTYTLVAKEGITELEADFVDNSITIYFPKSEQKDWANTDRVGLSNSVDWNDPAALSILVEKDFTCLDNTDEDQSDNYPNPLISKKQK